MPKDEDLLYYNIRANIEEHNPNVRCDDYKIFTKNGTKVLWITFLGTFKCTHIMSWLRDVCDYYDLDMVAFKVDESDHLVYLQSIDGVVEVHEQLLDISMSALKRMVIPSCKLDKALKKLYTVNRVKTSREDIRKRIAKKVPKKKGRKKRGD